MTLRLFIEYDRKEIPLLSFDVLVLKAIVLEKILNTPTAWLDN